MNERAKIIDYYLRQLDDPNFDITQVRRDLEKNNFDEEEIRVIVRLADNELQRRTLATSHTKRAGDLVYIGGVLTALGAGYTIATYTGLIDMGDSFLIVYGPFLGGLSILIGALAQKGKGGGRRLAIEGLKEKCSARGVSVVYVCTRLIHSFTISQEMQPTIKVRRPINSYIIHLVWTALTLYQALNVGSPARDIWGMLFILAVALMVRMVLKPNVMELKGTTLTVLCDFFSSINIDVSDIDRIEIKAGPLSSSRIVLKGDKRHVKFDYYKVRNADFDALTKSLKVPIG